MDISEATTLAAAIVALIQAFKQCIPDGYTTVTSLAVSLLLGVIAIAATGGFTGYGWGVSSSPQSSASPKPLHACQPSSKGLNKHE